ncbi:MAG: HEAT repeat domain-containing protein [candidate division Zixibacteria bacterium]
MILIGLTLLLILSGLSSEAAADSQLQEKIDSLFIIASSGEVIHRDQNKPAMDSIATYGRSAVPLLIDKFVTKSARERWTIIWTLERIGSDAVPDLISALDRIDGLVVQRVCWALGSIGDSSSVEPLMGVASHPRWQVRSQALTALGKIGDTASESVLLTALEDSIGQVRKSAVVATGRIGSINGVEHLVRKLDDPFYGARLMAIESLLLLDTQTVMASVAGNIGSGSSEMSVALACQLLGRIGTDEAIRLLVSLLESENDSKKTSAALALVEADPDDNCGYRKLYLNDETDRLARLKIESALSAMSNGLR